MAEFIETDPASIQYVVDLLQQPGRNTDGDLAIRMIRSLAAELAQLRSAANNGAPAGLISVAWQCAECGRNWTRTLTPGFLPRYCPGDDGTMSACASAAKKRHDKATGAERVKRFRNKNAKVAGSDQPGAHKAIPAEVSQRPQAPVSSPKSPDLTQAQHHILNSVAMAQADGKGAKFTAPEVQATLGALIRRWYIRATGDGQYVLTESGRLYLADHLPLFGGD